MKICESKSENSAVDIFKPKNISLSVIGLSGSSDLKGVVGVGKSSICNRLVRPNNFSQKQLSALSSVDFYGDIINGSDWIYWDHIVETVDSKVYAFHIIEQTVLINDQTFQPFENFSESDYVSRATSDKINGSKRAYISPSQFSKSKEEDLTCTLDSKSTIDAFLLVFDVSEVNARDYQAQDVFTIKMLTLLQKAKKPIIIALSKMDIKSPKIRSRIDTITDRPSFKSIPIIETSAMLNINISLIPSIVISEIQHHHRPLSLKIIKKSYKIKTYNEIFATKEKIREEYLNQFRILVNEEVDKGYDISWQDFASRNNLSKFLNIIDECELISKYDNFKVAAIRKRNESMVGSYQVLFKKLLFEFISPMIPPDQSVSENITSKLLENQQFLLNFEEEDVLESEFFRPRTDSKEVKYPLPRFFIDLENPMNKLYLVESCIEEIKFHRIEKNFADKFLISLESDPEQYEDMSFSDVDCKFKDQPTWNHFKDLAKSIFVEFVEKRISHFKILFDEKLLELSIMIFMCMPVKTCMRKCSIKEKDYKEQLPDMELIDNINKKIYFEHNLFDKPVYKKQRIKLVVKYIGSLISSNPCQCYHFDFNTAKCHSNLLNYLQPFKRFVQAVALVVSSDEVIDFHWSTLVKDNTMVFDSDFVTSIEFISSKQVLNGLKDRISSCQKLIILANGNQNDGKSLLNRFHEEHIDNGYQVSIVDVECYIRNLNNSFVNSDNRNSETKNSFNQHLFDVIKDQTMSYIHINELVYIWIIVLCDDTYDCSIPASLLLSLFADCIVLEQRIDNSLASVTIVYTLMKGDIPQRLRVTVLSYHQAFKLLNDECQCFNLHLLLFFCDFDRLASINTMFAVLKNLFKVVNVKSVMCAIKSSHLYDDDDFLSRKKMLLEHAFDSNASCIIIDNGKGQDTLNADESHKLRTIFTECVHLVNCVDENKNLYKYNAAYENEDLVSATRLKIENNSWNQGVIKDGIRTECQNECMHQNYLFRNRERVASHSDYQIASNNATPNKFFLPDQEKEYQNYDDVIFVDSEPLGSFNEHMIVPIEKEEKLSQEVQDTSTIILIRCTNLKHIGFDEQLGESKKSQRSSKFRSLSGPVQSNKSFSRKYSTVQNALSRSQRCSTKKSQSCTTSPITSSMKSNSQNAIVCTHCKGNHEYCICCHTTSTPVQSHIISTSKCIKNVFSRFFSSERCSNKSAEERRNIFSRSMRSSKKSSEKKNKNQISNSSSEGIFNSSGQSSNFFPLQPLHSTSLSVADTRIRTKAVSKTVFSI